MNITKTNLKVKMECNSSFILYITKTYTNAHSIHEFALTQRNLLTEQGWYYTVQSGMVTKQCFIPEFFHEKDYFYTLIEHNNGDWKKEKNFEIYIVENN